jgi:hypothetical protein
MTIIIVIIVIMFIMDAIDIFSKKITLLVILSVILLF